MRNLFDKIFKKVDKHEDTPEARVAWAIIMLGSFCLFLVFTKVLYVGGC